MAANQLRYFPILLYAALVSGFSSDCVAPSQNRCPSNNFKSGSLSLSCSGPDFILDLKVDEEMLSLSIFAECSEPCSQNRRGDVLYYYDLSGASVSELNAIDRTINGSSKLGMPKVSETESCRVFGCYLSWETFNMESFQPVLCTPPEAAPTVASSTEEPYSSSPVPVSSEHQDTPSTPVRSSILVPVTTDLEAAVIASNHFNITPLIVGVSVFIAMIAVLAGTILLLYILNKYLHFYHRRKPHSVSLQFGDIYGSIVPDFNVEDKIKVQLDHRPLSSLSDSQLSIFSPLKYLQDGSNGSSCVSYSLDVINTRTSLDIPEAPHLDCTTTSTTSTPHPFNLQQS